MKSALVIAAASLSAVAAAPCDLSLLAKLTPLAALSAPCATDSGYDFVASALTGKLPTAEQIEKFNQSANCETLYKTLTTTLAGITPACSIAGVETTKFADLPKAEAIKALISFATGSAGATGNSTSSSANATASNSTAVNSTATKAPNSTNATAAPTTTPKSGAATGVVSLAAVGFTLYFAQ